ncbi:XdhC family protein [Seongchinamella sediminis]|uniref:XdhC family protein n=1 Tax=Seongchinamella sediminis TaxID=2283635 RepID=A0A3L7DXZ8_9GAMM|nr:XdhC family protein [Seongchinamella sediminis]RLQ21063.1 XdhC family protein [Seongchinamella sediminis]
MQTLDYEVLQRLLAWLEQGERPWLCTIVTTIGSAPRPLGSLLAVLDRGEQIGSVSGGCVEEDLLERLRAGFYTGERPELVEYGVSAEENERLGLPCGGRLVLLIQQLQPADSGWLGDILAALDRRHCIERCLDLATGATGLRPVAHFSALTLSEQQLTQCFGPRMRILLVGAGQLAQSLAELGLAMDYEVLVTDPRREFLDQWSGPDIPRIQGMPDDVVRERANDRHSIIITLTHDPRIDDMALMEALGSEAWYVGALGSVRTTEKRLRRLRQLELPEQQIERLHAPVGLPIGSKTPIEIAVSIMAELTQLRRTSAAT